ncbi:MAG: transglutaminase family protein [Candidatus Marinimicrobia bacterium]|jgi:transglutaminase-like putative cysteine protease|nr:transglutaminase family protein [Candidatus Neomarinimicrobiota bacterium]
MINTLNAILMDDQPISASFFNEGRWLTDFVTPEAPDIIMLHDSINKNSVTLEDKAIAAWDWVANEVRYKSFISARINVEGVASAQNDFWQTPSMCSHTHVGNCVNKAFLLTSLLRRDFPDTDVYCVLGNLYNGHAAGHAWVEAAIDGKTYILEATRNDVPLLPVEKGDRYEPVHYVNDKKVLVVPDRTVITPFQACYSSWLKDYLDWTYINGGRK